MADATEDLVRNWRPEAALPSPPPDPDATRNTHLPAGPQPVRQFWDAAGVVILGRYELLACVGEGGMGAVWSARQLEPVKRGVAVKLIKAGADSKAVLARFEAERQALAVMDHPNIAKILDGGVTGWGRAVLRHGAGPRRADHAVLRRPAAGRPSAARAVRPAVRGDPARPPEGRHPPGHQAVERAGRPRRRRPAGAQGDRLRHRQGDRPGAHRPDPPDPRRRGRRHAAVHVARAGDLRRPRHRTRGRTCTRWACCSTNCSPAARRSRGRATGATTRSRSSG